METEEVYDEPANDTSHMDADVVENGSRIVNASMYSRNALNIPTYHSGIRNGTKPDVRH